MNRSFFKAPHLIALFFATLVLWAFREFSAPLAGSFQSAAIRERWQSMVSPSHFSTFVFAVLIVLCISIAQELASDKKRTLLRAVGIGGLMGVIGMGFHFSEAISPELRNSIALRGAIMIIGYVAASVMVFAGKRYGGAAEDQDIQAN